MLDQSDKERLAILETNIPWIKDSVARIELAEKERAKALERHLLNHPNGNGNGGVRIIIGKKALTVLVSGLATGPLAALFAYLRSQGFI